MTIRQKILVGAVSVVVLVLLVLAGVAYHLITKSFPQTSGSVSIRGLQSEVTVFRDEYGVPHLFASSDRDGYFAVGYTHAQERLWQMELIRRAGMGRLSEILGEPALVPDKMFRTLGIWRLAKTITSTLDPRTRTALQDYADGVNSFIETHKGKYPVEFDMLSIEPEPWTVEHSIVVSRLMAWELNYSRWVDILQGELISRFGDQRAGEIIPSWPAGAPVIVPTEKKKRTAYLPYELMEADRSYRKLLGMSSFSSGSNAWVVGSAKSITGKPIVADDPHLILMIPARWYELHLTTPSLNVAGPTIAGVPFVVIGRNERIAWGVTNAMMDDADYYTEEVDSVQHPTKYKFKDEWRPLTREIDTILVKGALPVVYTSYWTHHGPIINRIEPSAQFSSQLISMRWTGSDVSNEALAFYGINRAANWDEFKTALKSFGSPSQNFVYGDVDGNIGYYTSGRLPLRTSKAAIVPYPPNSAEYEWKGYVPFEQMPQRFNPPDGFIATANNKITDDAYPYYISNHWEPSWRIARITEVLKGMEKISVEDVQRLQVDLVSPQAREIVPIILKAYEGQNVQNNDVKTALTYFRTWDYQMKKEDVATTLFEVFFVKVIHNTFRDEFGTQLMGLYDTLASTPYKVTTELLKKDSSDWFDDITTPQKENRNDIIRKSMDDAVKELKQLLGGELKEWQWGRLHKIEFKHVFGANDILKRVFNIGPFPVGGSHSTIWKGDYNLSTSFANTVGPSTRQIFDLADMNNGRAVTPPGQSGQVFFRNYDDQVKLWLLGTYRRMPMRREMIQRTCKDVLTLEPER
jgi:penicillin amidase